MKFSNFFYLVYCLSFLTQPLVAHDAANSPLFEDDTTIANNQPELQFVLVPAKISAYIVALRAADTQKTVALENACCLIESGLSVMPHAIATAALSKTIQLHAAHRMHCSDEAAHTTIMNELVEYQTALEKGITYTTLEKINKIVCQTLVAKKIAKIKKLIVADDAQVIGNLTVDGNVIATTINGSTPYTNGTVPDNVFVINAANDATKQLRVTIQGAPKTKTTIITKPSIDRTLTTPDIDGTLVVAQANTNQVFIGGSTTPPNGSNAGMQYSSAIANRAQGLFNQYGSHAGIPGITTFKSRNTAVDGLGPVKPGDVILRNTALGVANDLTTPPSGFMSINVAKNSSGSNYIPTEYELQLVSLDGPSNSIRPVFKVSSEGVLQLLESTSAGSHTTVPSGVVTLNGAGVFTVLNNKIPANARIMLTVQPSKAPTGTIYVSNITANTSFQISSTAHAADANVKVYYQVYIPLA